MRIEIDEDDTIENIKYKVAEITESHLTYKG